MNLIGSFTPYANESKVPQALPFIETDIGRSVLLSSINSLVLDIVTEKINSEMLPPQVQVIIPAEY